MFSQIPGTFRCSTWVWLHLHLTAQLSVFPGSGAGSAPIFSLTHARSRGGNTAVVQASCTAPFHHTASALQTAFERGSPRTAAAGFPVLPALPLLPPHHSATGLRWPRTQLARTAGSHCAAENPQLCLISIFLGCVGNLSGA